MAATFPPTPWTILRDIANAANSDARNAAISHLCRHYWFPLYAFARWKRLKHQDAQDQTQAFLARLIENNAFADADPGRGKFRSFLRSSFQNHLFTQWQHDNAQRRGGGVELLSLDMVGAEERFDQGAVLGDDSEVNFDRVWALAVIEACLEELAQTYREKGDSDEFPIIRGFLDPSTASASNLAAAAELLGISELAMRQRVSRARMRFSKILRNHIAGLLADPTPEAIQDELRYLRDAISRS